MGGRANPTLIVLSVGWLALCTGLVVKHGELLVVFCAFCASFVLATLLARLQTSPLKAASSSSLEQQRHEADGLTIYHQGTRNRVGVCMNTASLWYLSSASEASAPDDPAAPLLSVDYVALSLAAGYLAFDHWYTGLYCQPPLNKPLMRVTEDATALSLLSILLASSCSSLYITSSDALATYRPVSAAWLAYQIIRLALTTATGTNSAERISRRTPAVQTTTTTPPPTTNISSKEKSLSSVLPPPSLSPPLNDKVLWQIDDQRYDLREFVDRHPGGKEAMLLGQGRDCTALFYSYHPFTATTVHATLAKYRLANKHEKATRAAHTPRSTQTDVFYQVLRQRVEETLRQQGFHPIEDRAANRKRILYYGAVFVTLLYMGRLHMQGIILGSFGLAVTGWLIGAAGHDAGHFAVSRTPWVNDVGVWGMSLLSNPMLWQHQHTYAHHSFTNEFAHDPDLHHFDALLRVHRNFQHNGIYRNQRKFWFVVVAYALVVFGTCVWIPLGMLQKGHLYGVVEWTDRKRPVRALAMSLHYAGYVGLIMLAPFFATAWSTALACVVTHVGTSGLIFALFSQINHLNEASLELDKSQRHKDARSSWAADQVETSNNFAPTSVLWYYLSNGLNLQIEHHLFPGLNHCHLHRIVPVVRQTCEDYGVDYKSWSTWSDLFGAARAWLDKLSESTDYVEPPSLDRKTR